MLTQTGIVCNKKTASAAKKGVNKTMKDMMKKVVILDNLASPYVHQAIIVMRDYDPRLESRAVIEAERIVNAYLDNMKLTSEHNRSTSKKKKNILLYALCALICVATAAAVIFL